MKTICQIFLISVIISIFSIDAIAQDRNYPEKLSLSQGELSLKGQGVRRKYFMTVYSLGLYLNDNISDKICSSKSYMNMRLVVESSFLSREKLEDAVVVEFKKQAGKKYNSKKQQLDRFILAFGEGVKKGDVFDFCFVESNKLMIYKNDVKVQEIHGLEFKQLLYKIWIGDKPVDDNLKYKLLGN